MKRIYESPELEIINFTVANVLASPGLDETFASGGTVIDPEEEELEP